MHEGQPRGEKPSPTIIDINQEFRPFTLPQKEYYGFVVDDVRYFGNPKASHITLHTELLPDLDFNIITVQSDPEQKRVEIYIESDPDQAIRLELVHKTGRRTAAFPSHQPYGFNQDILPTVKRLRFKFVASDGESEAEPDERALYRDGKVEFKFIARESILSKDLIGLFRLEDDTKS